MEISDRVKDLLNKYKEEINNNDFIFIYSDLNDNSDIIASDIGELTELFLSANINPLNFLNEVPDYFLYNSKIKEINIPPNITRIGESAFKFSKLETINIFGDLYQGISNDAFELCYNLRKVTFNKVRSIGESAFCQCFNLEEIHLPEGVRYISNDTFYGSGLKTIYIPKSVRRIWKDSLACNDLKTIYYGGNKDEWQNLIRNSSDYIGIPDKTEIIYNS